MISAVCMADSPNVVRVYTYWVETDAKYDKYCILMELCETNLANYIHKRCVEDKSHFTEPEIWEIICHIMEGIQRCHDLNFTHRDLKPQNSNPLFERKILIYSIIFIQNEDMEVVGLWDCCKTSCFSIRNSCLQHSFSSVYPCLTNPISPTYTSWTVCYNASPIFKNLHHEKRLAGLCSARASIPWYMFTERGCLVNWMYSLRTGLW